MKLETLKKNNKKKILIGGLIGLSLVSVIGFTTTRAKYKTTQNLRIANGTINYTSADLNLIAMYQANSEGTYDATTSVPTNGYKLNTEKSVCNINGTKDTSIDIKYSYGKITIGKLTKKGTKCYLYFDKSIITNVNELIESLDVKSGTPDFSVIATKEESEENNGIYRAQDGMYGGYSYYWRGAATTNHVIFAEKCWRIVRINGDKTLRLIYNGEVQTGNTCFGNGTNADSVIIGATDAEKYFATSDGQYNNASYAGWTYTLGKQRPADNATATDSNAKVQTEKWYKTNIIDKGYDGKVATGKYCVDRNTGEPYHGWDWGSDYTTEWSATGTKFAYAAVDRVWNKYQPTLSCDTKDVYNLKVGAIIADEIEFAGGKLENNTAYYLYNGQNYWSMSPGNWNSSNTRVAVFYVHYNGQLTSWGLHATWVGLRPVINLNADVTFNEGSNGTKDNPYIVQ